jgi:two-component sensor histidine kinase
MALTQTPKDVRLALPPAPEAAVRARHALLDAGLSGDLEHTVPLLASELVANSVRHAGLATRQRIVLRAHLEPDFARVEVYDAGEGFDPEVRHATKGFGLRLVDKLATRWGTDQGEGCGVWFEVDRRRRRFDRAPSD